MCIHWLNSAAMLGFVDWSKNLDKSKSASRNCPMSDYHKTLFFVNGFIVLSFNKIVSFISIIFIEYRR